MKFIDVRKYITGLLSASFVNKEVLDNLAENESGSLTYKGAAIEGGGSEPAQTIYIENITTHSTVPFTKIIATTAELIDGESSLEDGVLYLVYEAD